MRKLLLTTVALVGLTTASLANPTELARIKQIEPLLYDFIYKHTDYNPSYVPPVYQYVFKSEEELNLMYYGTAEVDNFSVEAIYSDGVVFLREGFNVREKAFILLHELVHHVQFNSGKQFGCPEEMEAEAYDLMDKYVDVSGNGEKTDRLFRMFLTCRPELGWR